MTACLNAANERANELFRGEKLGYLGTYHASDDLLNLFEMQNLRSSWHVIGRYIRLLSNLADWESCDCITYLYA